MHATDGDSISTTSHYYLVVDFQFGTSGVDHQSSTGGVVSTSMVSALSGPPCPAVELCKYHRNWVAVDAYRRFLQALCYGAKATRFELRLQEAAF